MLPHIRTPDEIFSPGLIVFRDRVRHNLETMIRIAGDPLRLRPHCKTHKMAAVTKLQLAMGITRHKASTFAEAEMLAHSGVPDIVLGYPLVGPNIARAVQFRKIYPDVKFAVTADDPEAIEQLGAAMTAAGTTIGVMLDVNPGRDRTGLPPGDLAAAFYRKISQTPGLEPAGFHFYDGHQIHPNREERQAAVLSEWRKAARFRDELEAGGLQVPRISCGGTPTFPIYAELNDAAIELSPGTCVFHDAGYGERYADLEAFLPAAYVLTRVVSRPTSRRVTFDAGTKSVASDPPMGERVRFADIPDAVQVVHNEEHLVIETEQADRFRPGDWTLVLPRHICPTSALYSHATVIEGGEIVDEWKVTARDRRLRI
ncbi:D-TA family PLP-dependent enzyme [Planctomicrobium sp. SH661]|uniref:D-TA family PLP-dependent enzyme n=1 Tax=Planctomicrobium sp. SH661 TaxID=3448124 RepID=UPI003F5B48A7